MKTGISVYLSTGYKRNEEIIKKASQANVTHAFTSLHIPEEEIQDYKAEVKRLLTLCKAYNLHLMMDIGPRTLDKLGIQSFSELKALNVTHIRLDYGFTYEQIIELSNDFHIIFNASTLGDEDIKQLRKHHANFEKFAACHNYYPKKLTGLSIDFVRETNKKMKSLGMTTMGFIPSHEDSRGPLYEGLPTVEAHRYNDFTLSLAQLHQDGLCDICFIGDIDLSDQNWLHFKEYQENIITLKANIHPDYQFIMDIVHHDRPDSSEFVIRSQESRSYGPPNRIITPLPKSKRILGSISIGNEKYLRYSGEVEIARIYLPLETRVNIIGQIDEKYLCYLPYIRHGMGFRFVNET